MRDGVGAALALGSGMALGLLSIHCCSITSPCCFLGLLCREAALGPVRDNIGSDSHVIEIGTSREQASARREVDAAALPAEDELSVGQTYAVVLLCSVVHSNAYFALCTRTAIKQQRLAAAAAAAGCAAGCTAVELRSYHTTHPLIRRLSSRPSFRSCCVSYCLQHFLSTTLAPAPATAMEDIGPPPAACPHCGHDDPNEFLPMGGAYFCGACGKKLSTSTTFNTNRTNTQPPTSQPLTLAAAEESKEAAGDEAMATPTKESKDGDANKASGGMSSLFARLTSGGKAKRGEENKENAAPTGTPVASASVSQTSGSSMQTPTKLQPALTTPISNALSPSSSSSSALPSPLSASSAAVSSPMSPAAAAANLSNGFGATTPARSAATTTPQRFAATTPSRPAPTTPSAAGIQSTVSADGPTSPSSHSALAASIRAEVESQYTRDMALLNVECEQLHSRLLELTEERTSLQSMLDQSMNEYGAVVEDSVNKRNDYVAHVGILEAELSQLRQQRDHEATQLHTLQAQQAASRQQLDDSSHQVTQLTEQLSAANAEAEDWKTKYEQLRETATTKLKQSGNEYLSIRQREQEKDIALQGLQRELHVVSERERSLAARVRESDERSERERGDRQLVEEELQACRSDLVTYTRELAEVKRQADEYRARMEENGAIAMRYKEQVLEQRERSRREEKERRDGGGGADEQRQRLELMRVRGELERKENENRELMEMVEGLLAQVEQQKAEAHDHNETY